MANEKPIKHRWAYIIQPPHGRNAPRWVAARVATEPPGEDSGSIIPIMPRQPQRQPSASNDGDAEGK